MENSHDIIETIQMYDHFAEEISTCTNEKLKQEVDGNIENCLDKLIVVRTMELLKLNSLSNETATQILLNCRNNPDLRDEILKSMY